MPHDKIRAAARKRMAETTDQALEATTHGYDNSRSFLEELCPGNAHDASTMSATPRDTPRDHALRSNK